MGNGVRTGIFGFDSKIKCMWFGRKNSGMWLGRKKEESDTDEKIMQNMAPTGKLEKIWFRQ